MTGQVPVLLRLLVCKRCWGQCVLDASFQEMDSNASDTPGLQQHCAKGMLQELRGSAHKTLCTLSWVSVGLDKWLHKREGCARPDDNCTAETQTLEVLELSWAEKQVLSMPLHWAACMKRESMLLVRRMRHSECPSG